jgi:hypothetical protein
MGAHEAEIYAAGVDAAKEAVHLHRLLQDLGPRWKLNSSSSADGCQQTIGYRTEKPHRTHPAPHPEQAYRQARSLHLH